MEQKTMFCLSSSRNHSPLKVFNFKKVLQVALLIAAVIWLLYQLKNSHDYGGVTQKTTIIKEHETETSILLGRKGIGRKEDGGVGDDEFDTNIEEIRDNVIEVVEKQYIEKIRENEKGEEKLLVHTSEMEGTSEAIDQGDIGHGIHSFHDQTGVPLAGLIS